MKSDAPSALRPRALPYLGALLLTALPVSVGAVPQPAASPQGGAGVKIVPKPVPCVPCPCECPDPRTLGAGGGPPLPPPAAGTDAGSEGHSADARPDARPGDPKGPSDTRPDSPPRPPPVLQVTPRGNIAGQVTLRERSGAVRGDNSEVVVYIEKMPLKRFAALKRTRAMAQRDKTFTPHVLAVTKGSTVEFPNEDRFFHNVFSLSEGNTFDLGLYRAGTSRNVTFEKAGVVDVFCNIHPNMWAQILVLENPYYAVTSKDGAFEIPKVPTGTYTLVAWARGSDQVKQQVRVDQNGRAQVKFELQEGASNKPHLNKFNQPYGRYK